ncbi:lanthionine synthetase C family protein [Streptococcus equinus]|uniref:lanthionine synthetase C family protein n=1 Tax=Streptococcus equinus TaxID=1335 RepID=UPI0008717530|nr:lanthionine synthetase C family protein [Streptococcus equinus]QMS95782.1 nisin MDC lanthionine synthetase NmdC [Streptococcus equinus]SCW31527.1 Lanthionine synthetase C-like protein [Streptococcus equinus]SEK27251.1 Lanthionine synthetase C-like protein [Streptococcus equinus]SFQ62406.1 Lanthionine synthetase C-like protein [Streptococcus equinus]
MGEREIIINLSEQLISDFDKKLVVNKDRFELMTLSSGLPGMIFLCSELYELTKDEYYFSKIDSYIIFMVNQLKSQGVFSDSLFSGAAGIGICLLHLINYNSNYQNLINSLNNFIDYYTSKKIDEINVSSISPTDYDIIEGISGVLIYLLQLPDDCLKDLKLSIVNFLSDLVLINPQYTGFYVESVNQMSDTESKFYPDGSLNFGVAHGLAGVGVALCYAKLRGVFTGKSIMSIQRLVTFYEKYELPNHMWKEGLDRNELLLESVPNFVNEFIRDAWCYGSPGISLFYLYSGIVLEDSELIEKACRILKTAVKRGNGLEQSILCHGYAGLVEICFTFRNVLKNNKFDKEIEILYSQLLAGYDKRRRLGFDTSTEFEGLRCEENIGFLDGIIGILLTMLHLNSLNVFSNWQSAMLLFDDFTI